MPMNALPGWEFIDDHGTFELNNPHMVSYLYFPLINQAGMMSSVTPTLNGDAKRDQNTFLLLPVSVEDLHNTRSARNFWFRINGEPWSVTGNSAEQVSHEGESLDEDVSMQGGFLWHRLNRRHAKTKLAASVTNFVPVNGDGVELMRVTVVNEGHQPLELTPIAAIPIYGRSADDIRDHRHVTSLLHRTTCHAHGVSVRPTMSFDERGHKLNTITYTVLGTDGVGTAPQGFTPLVEDFIGEGGCFTWPDAVIKNVPDMQNAGSTFDGFESIGGLHFQPITLNPGESQSYILVLAIMDQEANPEMLVDRYGSSEKFTKHLHENQAFWKEKLATLQFGHQDERRDNWLRWVTLQPVFRRIMGNSFLPYHDYGRGGRGWRDLWQDLLALLLTEPEKVSHRLVGYFSGVRMDGSNATIVGSRPGEFKADRNSIPRVWMDHGAWPLITTRLYLDLTGDLSLLLEKKPYFRDHLSHRCQKIDADWDPGRGTVLNSTTGQRVVGTVLEHLLVQHLTVFFNVGEHNIIRLEGGDWNDGLDMAEERGESVAFSAMYAGNLRTLSELCQALVRTGVEETAVATELVTLLDRVSDPVDYESIDDKQSRLAVYFDSVEGELSGEKQTLSLEAVAADLREKAAWLADQIRQQEWITDQAGHGWFNGYYDNQGKRVEGLHPKGVRMTLTGQVFPLMAGIADDQQANSIIQTADDFLYDPALKGYRLNTDFGTDLPELGRAFSYAYGHKENGAVFSHMAVMFSYALYQQGLAGPGWRVLDGLYRQSQDFSTSRMYPGIPEYFNPRGRGMYPYLTGSASWYMLTLLTEAYGVKGDLGDLCLAPKLVSDQFARSGRLRVETRFAGKKVEVVYLNPDRLSYGAYEIKSVRVNGADTPVTEGASSIRFARSEVKAWPGETQIEVYLGKVSGRG